MFNGCTCITIWAHLLIAISFANVLCASLCLNDLYFYWRALISEFLRCSHTWDRLTQAGIHPRRIYNTLTRLKTISSTQRRIYNTLTGLRTIYQTLNIFQIHLQHILQMEIACIFVYPKVFLIKECYLKHRLHLKTYCIWTMLTYLLTYFKVWFKRKCFNVELFQDTSGWCCFCC